MYLLANGELCSKTKRKAQHGNYIVAIIEQGKGYRISLIDSRTNCEAVSNFRFDYDSALDVATKTFNILLNTPQS
jgi:hypothetical protein